MSISIDALQLDALGSDPSSLVEGSVWYDDAAKCLKSYQGGTVQIVHAKSNLAASRDPLPTDDSSQGYSAGSRWMNQTSGNEFVCFGASTGNAAWYRGTATGFGDFYLQTSSEGVSTTTSSAYQTKLSLSTGAWIGNCRVGFYCEVTTASNSKRVLTRLYDQTLAQERCFDDYRPATSGSFKSFAGFSVASLTGTARTFTIDFSSQDNTTQVSIQRARLEIWRVL